MSNDRGLLAVRLGALAAVAVFLTMLPGPAGAYLYDTVGNTPVSWGAGSPTTIWNNGTKTLNWSFNRINFPQGNWPTPEQAGAAFQNSYQTLADTVGTSIRFNRLPDTNSVPAANDGLLQMSLAPNASQDYYGTNISGAFAVTYVRSSGTDLQDADIVFNGDTRFFNWSTSGPPAPGGTNDIEVTSVHEQFHSVGSGHPVYYYSAVWWTGRYPETLMYDRDLGPDDRVLLRTLYPAGTALANIAGQVTLATGGTAVDRAVVVATDTTTGIPHATVVTDSGGNFNINVPPPVTAYTLSAHHGSAITYSSDIDFTGATDFFNTNTRVVTAATGQNFTVMNGTPTMQLSLLALSSVTPLNQGNASQTLFLSKNTTQNFNLEFTDTGTATPLVPAITAVSFGPGITVTTGATTASNNAGFVLVAVTANVSAAAGAGCRNITATRGAEKVILPSFVEVVDTGALTVSAGGQNPAAGAVAFNTANAPLLQFILTASAVEDIRIRKLQFTLAGTGAAPANVRLYRDSGATAGIVDGTDVRIFSGDAYAVNPIAETLTPTPPATILFDNLAVTIPAGTSQTFLLTMDAPAAGSGSYTASFVPSNAANITSHGMYWGDVITPTGGTVTGGTQSLGQLAVGTLNQVHTTAPQNNIPVGGSTNEAQITLRGTVSASTGTLGMDVEHKPIGTPFSNTPTASSATTSPSGTQIALNVTGLTSGTAYHWQARATSSASGPSAWVSFGANSEAATDFTVDTSTTTPPNPLAQFEQDGVTVMALGGSCRGQAVLQGTTGTNNQGLPVRLEVEVQPTGTAFTGNPQWASGFVTGGALAQIAFTGPTNDYHWQARCATQFGGRSGFTVFNAAPINFHLDAIQTIQADAGCIGRTSGTPDGAWALCCAAGALLITFSLLRKGGRKAASTLVLLLCLGAVARAAEDPPLPRSLADVVPPGAAVLTEPEPVMARAKSIFSLDAYLGMLFMDLDFQATGTDFVRREVKGIGTALVGVEGQVEILPDWRLGLVAEVGIWSDIRILSIGPEVAWQFAGSHRNAVTGLSDNEHFLKLALFYEKLTVSKNNFGDFDSSFGVRLGYEMRLTLNDSWAVTLGAFLQYSQWNYSPAILSGDDKIGGFGGLISVGIAWLP